MTMRCVAPACEQVNDDDIVASDNVVMMRWVFATRNAVSNGAAYECRLNGMLFCTFAQSRKIISCEFVFDVLGFMQQLQTASGGPGMSPSSIVANTFQMALAESEEALVGLG